MGIGALFLALGLALACGGGGGGTAAPTGLAYSANPAVYTLGTAITTNAPTSSGGAVASYAVSPALPLGLALSTSTGIISGTPTAVRAAANYTVTATNSGGSATATLNITVNDAPPVVSYTANAVFTRGAAITPITPSSTGGTVTSYSITPSLPAGLDLDAGTGTISGTPTAVATAADYTVAATNTGGSTTASLNLSVVDPPSTPSITVPAHVTANQAGYVASVPSQTGSTYAWTVTGASVTAGTGTRTITFTPASSGTVGLSCTVTNAAGTPSAPGMASATIVAAPSLPIISAATNVTASQAGYVASVPSQTGCTYAWTVTGASVTAGAGTRSITFTPAASGTVGLSCIVSNAAGTASAPGTASATIVAAPSLPIITAPTYVTAGLAGYVASVPAQAGNTYAWTVSGAAITAGTGTRSITFTPASSGTVGLSCIVTNAAGTPSAVGTASATIVAQPTLPVITAAANVTASQAGYVASVPSQPDSTYAWTVTGASVTDGTGTPSITFTPDASGTVALSCIVTNAAGTPSSTANASATIVAAPTVPIITAPTDVTGGKAGYAASVPPQTDSAYAWTITNGSITAGETTAAITFTPAATGTVNISCTVTNAAGTASTPGTADANIIAAPSITGFTTSAALIHPGDTPNLTPSYTGGAGVITPGPISGFNSGDLVPVSPSNTTTYTLTVTNSLGDTATQSVDVTLYSSLAISITGLSGINADVLVTGPNGYSQTLTSSQTLTDLEAGDYTITAATVTDTTLPGLGRGNGGTLGPVNLERHPYLPMQTVTVAATGVVTATVQYPAPTLSVSIPDSTNLGSFVPMDFVLVPAGSFDMGAPDTSPDPNPDGGNQLNPYPVHTVTFDRAFYMAKTPCTQAQWKAVRGASYFEFPGDSNPAESMTWAEIRGTDGFLTQLHVATGGSYTFALPSEAQWEYACRAGTTTAYFFGADATDLELYAWTLASAPDSTQPVATKRPNPWGLYDMIGNVWVWMEDDAIHAGDIKSYLGAPTNGSAWLESTRTATGVLRGGGRDPLGKWYRSAIRYDEPFDFPGGQGVGLRLVLSVPTAP